jgi:hypothetical protein
MWVATGEKFVTSGPSTMRRRKKAAPTARDGHATQPFVITPTTAYRPEHLREGLSLTRNTLRREIKLKRLRVSKRAGKYYFLGSWVLEWLEGGELRPGGPGADPV